jgi:hypothetical protein
VRRACVRRSIASATTAGDGGNGTLDAKERFDSADARGVRVKAERARVVAGSTSESSLEEFRIVVMEEAYAHLRRVKLTWPGTPLQPL